MMEHIQGQVQSMGQYVNYLNKHEKNEIALVTPLIILPEIDNKIFLKEAKLELKKQRLGEEGKRQFHVKPMKFAQSVMVNKNIIKESKWKSLNSFDPIMNAIQTGKNATASNDSVNLQMLEYEIHSKGALSLSLSFSDFHLSKGAELYILTRDQIIGAFIGEINNRDHGKFSTMPLSGDRLKIVLIQSKEKSGNGKVDEKKEGEKESRLFLSTISHGFRPLPWNYPLAFGDSGSCNEDIACVPINQWNQQSRSTVMLLTDSGQRFCSGSMINNAKLNADQLILTAEHCLFDSVDSWIAAFNYQNVECGKPSPPIIDQRLQTAHGMKLISKWNKSDFALLKIEEPIPREYNIYLSGWNRNIQPPSNVFCIHHPSGDLKKISFYNGTCDHGAWQEAPNQYHWLVPKWSRGTTEPGSSGGPLFDSDGLLVGHLHGGQSSCEFLDGYDLFGGIAFDWDSGTTPENRLKDHLGSEKYNSPILLGASLNMLRDNQHIIRKNIQERDGIMNLAHWSHDHVVHESFMH